MRNTLLCVVLIVVGVTGHDLLADNPAADALLAVVEVERSMLDDERERYQTLKRRRAEIDREIAAAYEMLDAALAERAVPKGGRLARIADQLARASATRDGILAVERVVVDRIAGHLQRLELLGLQIDSLDAREETRGALTGDWDLVLMPATQRGSISLVQTGAIVRGTYELEGGWIGSLEGTLVNRKVFLVRIDSKLGKSMELEGYLSGDGRTIRGSWLNYELAGSDGATGQWSAQRRDAR